MTGPVDVQAERLRELAVAATKGAWPRTSPSAFLRDADAAFIAACDPQTILGLLDLLAGQAEQIERASLDVAKLSTANAELEDERDAVVRQRDNLRDALQEMAEAFAAFHAAPDRLAGLAELLNREHVVREALRAAAVGEEEDRAQGASTVLSDGDGALGETAPDPAPGAAVGEEEGK